MSTLKIDRSRTSPNRSRRSRSISRIVIHHWDDPAKRPRFDPVVSWLCNPRSKVSAHYVVESGRVAQLVPEGEAAWHARGGNADSIGIEINPRQSDGDYATAAQLIQNIRARHGNLPLVRHRDVKGSSTDCPGTYDLARLDRLARGQHAPQKAAPSKAPAFPLPRRAGALYYYGSPSGPITSVSGRTRNTAVPADVVARDGRWHSIGLQRWQERMRERGYSIAADGRYGPETERAARNLQRLARIAQDGKIGPDTWSAAWTLPVQ